MDERPVFYSPGKENIPKKEKNREKGKENMSKSFDDRECVIVLRLFTFFW